MIEECNGQRAFCKFLLTEGFINFVPQLTTLTKMVIFNAFEGVVKEAISDTACGIVNAHSSGIKFNSISNFKVNNVLTYDSN